MGISKKWILEPDIPGSFANHSCNPNCELIQISRQTMALVAICDIEPGTEICFDYAWPARDWIPKCRCGAPNCRGWVVQAEDVKKMSKLSRKRQQKKRKAK